ncbi:MAG TPA: RNA polymerase sigma factor [Gemmatimonadaceae bacterium]|nr:RNA polymerase sigma factor [Gemmatimonadaceae bacterium]
MESDAAVVKRVLNGEVEAFSILVERYFDHYVRFAIHLVGNREDAEEVVQDTFLRAYRALGRYEERERFGAWLLRILVNRARTVSAIGRRREKMFPDQPDAALPEAAQAHPEERAALREEMARALDQLGRDQREAFLLHYVEGLSYEEMAAVTGSGVSALKMRVKRSCERLREILQGVNRV